MQGKAWGQTCVVMGKSGLQAVEVELLSCSCPPAEPLLQMHTSILF